jgi:hypothetical protein
VCVCVCVCVCKGTAFSALIFWKIVLMFLWSDTLLVSGKSFSALVSHAVPAGNLQVTVARKLNIVRTAS